MAGRASAAARKFVLTNQLLAAGDCEPCRVQVLAAGELPAASGLAVLLPEPVRLHLLRMSYRSTLQATTTAMNLVGVLERAPRLLQVLFVGALLGALAPASLAALAALVEQVRVMLSVRVRVQMVEAALA